METFNGSLADTLCTSCAEVAKIFLIISNGLDCIQTFYTHQTYSKGVEKVNNYEEAMTDKVLELEAKNLELLAKCGHQAISINELNRIIDDIEDWGIVSCDEPLLKLISALKSGKRGKNWRI